MIGTHPGVSTQAGDDARRMRAAIQPYYTNEAARHGTGSRDRSVSSERPHGSISVRSVPARAPRFAIEFQRGKP